ncbi:MAG: GDSL-type esterase/lipase family protein, partial [Rikenellaceae bacterium]
DENCGGGGTTTLSQGDHPYIKTQEYAQSLAFNPDIVILKLGTNDSKAHNFAHIANYKADYQKIIDSYKEANPSARLILISPVKCYFDESESISDDRMQQTITPIIEELAIENDLEIVNGYPLLGTTYTPHYMPDLLHPSSVGAGLMAKPLYRTITQKREVPKAEIQWSKTHPEEGSFAGYNSFTQTNSKAICSTIVEPHNINTTHTWAVRLTQSQDTLWVDQQLLELGYHIVYIDKSQLEKAQNPAKEFQKIYKQMQKMGLSAQFTILSQDKVAVNSSQMDLPSTIEQSGVTFKNDDPTKATNHIYSADGLAENMCIHPIRGNEYRPAAGWKDGADWNQTADDITQTLATQHFDVLMLGNSITQGMATHRKLVGSCWNNPTLREVFGNRSWESAGISGDRTQHLLWRIKNGNYNAATPNYVTIAIGVNNAEDDAQSVYSGIMAVTQAALEEFPGAQIILFGMLPTAGSPERVTKYNTIIEMLTSTSFDSKRVHFVDPRKQFTTDTGELRTDLYRPDNIHIVEAGFIEWAKLIVKTIEQIEQ